MQEHITRRRSIAIGGTILTAGAAGIYAATDTAGAQATVSADGLQVEGGEFSPADGELYAPWVVISGAWSYRVDADPASWQAYLLVYDDNGSGSEAVGITDGTATAREATGTYALRGRITAASFWEPADFAVAPDGSEASVTTTVPIEVAFLVQDGSGETLVQARESADLPVTVNNAGMVMASLDGQAIVYAQDNSDDPTPTPPEA